MRTRGLGTITLVGLLLAGAHGPAAHGQAGFLEEVIVTAEKRETTLQDTAIAVSAFSQGDLERGLINNNMDIQMSVPNMLMTRDFFTTALIAIRGIGQLAVGSSADPGTGVHFNGIYLNNSRIFETEFFDTERVEVLRGPQGTLYGRNTTAGVINVIPTKASDEFEGFIDASYGNYGYFRTRGALNIPLGDNLSQRFSIFSATRDGFVDNIHNGDEIDDRDMYAVRSMTSLNIGDSTDIHLAIQYFDEDDNRMRGANTYCATDEAGILGCLPNRGQPLSGSANTGGTVGGLLTSLVGAATRMPFPSNDAEGSIKPTDPRKVNVDFTPQYEADETIVSLEINHDFGNYAFHSITGYHETLLSARNDYDMNVNVQRWPIETTYQRGPDGPSTVNYLQQNDHSMTEPEQWSQEFRINSNHDGRFNFMAGAFWLDYETRTRYFVHSSALSVYGQTLGIPADQWVFDNDTLKYELDTWALFGELYYDLSESMDLTVGLRYTDETKKASQRSIYLAFLANPAGPNGGYSDFESDSDEFTGKINLNYRLSEDALLHATVARSYKSGGFNPIDQSAVEMGLPAQFEPEFINSIELGIKSRVLNNSLQANLTAFYYDYEDLQVSKITQQTAINENTDADIMGVEGEFIWAPNENWRITWNISWLDTELGSLLTFDPADPAQTGDSAGIISTGNDNLVVACVCSGIEVDIEGGELPGAPKFNSFLEVRHGWNLDNGMRLELMGSYYWQDDFYTRVFNTEDDLLESWDVWNASVILTSADDNWYLEAWGRNLNDDDHWTGQHLQDAAVGLYRTIQLLEPRTFGVTAGYRF